MVEADEKDAEVTLPLVPRGAEVTLLSIEADDSTVDCLWDAKLLIVEAENVGGELATKSDDGEA